MKGEEIGLTIFNKQKVGWPQKGEFIRQGMVKGIETKKYKYTYTGKDLNGEKTIGLKKRKTLEVKPQCFARVEASTFSKIRSGLIEKKMKEQRRQITE